VEASSIHSKVPSVVLSLRPIQVSSLDVIRSVTASSSVAESNVARLPPIAWQAVSAAAHVAVAVET